MNPILRRFAEWFAGTTVARIIACLLELLLTVLIHLYNGVARPLNGPLIDIDELRKPTKVDASTSYSWEDLDFDLIDLHTDLSTYTDIDQETKNIMLLAEQSPIRKTESLFDMTDFYRESSGHGDSFGKEVDLISFDEESQTTAEISTEIGRLLNRSNLSDKSNLEQPKIISNMDELIDHFTSDTETFIQKEIDIISKSHINTQQAIHKPEEEKKPESSNEIKHKMTFKPISIFNKLRDKIVKNRN